MGLTRGQKLAVDQLDEISNASGGALEILSTDFDESLGSLLVQVSLSTKSYRQPNGFAFRDRERLQVRIYPNFPFTTPSLNFSHTRFIGQPHVQWGNSICLYQSTESEWSPSDGLYGFFQRVDEWMAAAGRGELDPDDAPLHPPVAYPTSTTLFVFDRDTPEIEPDGELWIGRADLRKKREGRFEVVGWVNVKDWDTAEQPEQVAAAILLPHPLPMEYPGTIDSLRNALECSGVSFEILYLLLKIFASKVPKDNPFYIVVGAPMRRKEAGQPLRQHLQVWEIDTAVANALHDINLESEDKKLATHELAKWMVTAATRWCPVYENRPEITNRRDLDSILTNISGKNILLLGCGALGSVVAEHLVRGGSRSLTLVDNGLVSPGLLVRQNYTDHDIGLAKSGCLARNLKGIGLTTTIEPKVKDLKSGIIDNFDLSHIDLIINATASTPVAHAIEQDLQRACLLIPLISISVSGAAQCGSVVVKMPRFSSGLLAIDRLTKIDLAREHSGHPVFKSFWPEKSELKLFQPEPGCSTPTFTGSSADLAAHAAILLNTGLQRTLELTPDQASSDLIPAHWTKINDSGALRSIMDDQSREIEINHNYEVLTSKLAQRGIASEIRRITRKRSDKVETGGLIFGEIDEAHGRIYIDSVTSPPPDSQASEKKFLCGISGTESIGESKLMQSAGSSRFIGIWHTHPISLGRPSPDDLAAMVQLLHGQEHPPRHVVMLIIGFSATYPEPRYYLFHRRDIRIVTEEELLLILEGKFAA